MSAKLGDKDVDPYHVEPKQPLSATALKDTVQALFTSLDRQQEERVLTAAAQQVRGGRGRRACLGVA